MRWGTQTFNFGDNRNVQWVIVVMGWGKGSKSG